MSEREAPKLSQQELERLYAAIEEQRRLEAEQGYQYDPIKPSGGVVSLLKKLAAPLVFLGLALWKFKFVLAAIFKLKIFTTAGSMLVSVGAYALLFGWKFGVALVALIFVHEMGHVLELRRQGVPASAPMFIPFVGAFVAMKEMPKDAWREAQVALAGPLVGTLGALALWGAAEAYDSTFLRAMAFVGFLINLFNLLPVVPLDGGRAVAALHPAIWAVGVVGLALLTWLRPNPILFIVVALGAFELWHRWKARHDPSMQSYYRVRPWQRVAVAVVYLGLAGFLAFAMHETHVPRSF
ncbi:MAG TPA: site-2 protease family protein [Gaiellaceae bacterium]|nr:site-2 protease family protein [Gaiellaceae bacterium]